MSFPPFNFLCNIINTRTHSYAILQAFIHVPSFSLYLQACEKKNVSFFEKKYTTKNMDFLDSCNLPWSLLKESKCVKLSFRKWYYVWVDCMYMYNMVSKYMIADLRKALKKRKIILYSIMYNRIEIGVFGFLATTMK